MDIDKDINGNTPLHLAILNNQEDDQIEIAIKNNICFSNEKNNDGNTPLHLAILNNKTKFAIILIPHTDQTLQNNDGNTPLHLAVSKNYGSIINFLNNNPINIKNKDDNTPLHIFFKNEILDFKIFSRLCKTYTEFNTKNKNGNTPLHLAVSRNDNTRTTLKIINKLLHYYVDLNIKNNKGNTPLHLVNYPEVAKLLIEKNPSSDIRNDNTETLIQSALKRNNIPVAVADYLKKVESKIDKVVYEGTKVIENVGDSGILEKKYNDSFIIKITTKCSSDGCTNNSIKNYDVCTDHKDKTLNNAMAFSDFSDLLSANNAFLAGGSLVAAYGGKKIVDEFNKLSNDYKDPDIIESIKKNGLRIEDLDIYVSAKDAKKLVEGLINCNYNYNIYAHLMSTYDGSFLRKNKILSRNRLIWRDDDKFSIDIMVVSNEITKEKVVTNFDLTFCEIYYDGRDVFSPYKEGIFQKKGKLKPDYVESLIINKNNFIINRISKYSYRGFDVKVPCDKNENNIITTKVKNIIDEEDWFVGTLYQSFRLFEEEYFNNIILGYKIDYLIPILKNIKLSDYERELMKQNKLYDFKFPYKYQKILEKFLPKIKHYLTYRKIVDNFIGIRPTITHPWKNWYTIDMTSDFCKYTQYKPLPFDDENLKEMLKRGKNKLIYSCMKGHLHSSDSIPQEISVCGYPTDNGSCSYLVGGLHHYLVPGCYIVYHNSDEYSYTHHGIIGTRNYAIYEKMYKQAYEAFNQEHDAIKKYMANEPPYFKKGNPYLLENIKKIDIKLSVAMKSQSYNAKNSSCFVCNNNIKQDDSYYVLPCYHIIHTTCLALIRGVKLTDVMNDTDANKDSIRGVIKNGNNELLIDTSHRSCPLEHNPPGPYPFLFGRTRSYKKIRKINKKSLKKIRKYSIKKMKFGETPLDLEKISYLNKSNTKTEELTESNKPNINEFLNTLYNTISEKKSKESITNELTRLNEIYKKLSEEFFTNKNKSILTYVVERSQTDYNNNYKVDLTEWYEKIRNKKKEQQKFKEQQKNIRLRKKIEKEMKKSLNEENTKS